MGEAVTYTALIKLVRLVSADTFEELTEGTLNPDRYCQRGGLRLLQPEGVPLIVDHDATREVGVVHGFLEFADTDGDWAWARATISDPPPWLKTGTRCSYGSIPVHRSHHGWIHRSLVQEVSLLSSDHVPLEPRAHVAVLKRTSPATNPAPSASTNRGVEEIRLPADAIIRRPSGRVLGVR